MKITWLGQAGLLFETGDQKIIIDPYLSDSCHKLNPKSYRRYGIDEAFLGIIPDILILTHNHLDHTDPESLGHYLGEIPVTVLASSNAWANVRKTFGGDHNYVEFNCGTEWTDASVTFRAVHAAHSDDRAIGVLFEAEGKTYYVTGDTLYSSRVFESLGDAIGRIDAVFLPINGRGNNMNAYDAARFAKRVGAKTVVPVHFGLFDEMNGRELDLPNTVIPAPFKEIPIN